MLGPVQPQPCSEIAFVDIREGEDDIEGIVDEGGDAPALSAPSEGEDDIEVIVDEYLARWAMSQPWQNEQEHLDATVSDEKVITLPRGWKVVNDGAETDPPMPVRRTSISSSGSVRAALNINDFNGFFMTKIAEQQEAAVSSPRRNPRLHHRSHQFAWLTQCAFSVATLVLFILWLRHVNEEAFVGTLLVNTVAASAYFAKATGMGDMYIAGAHIPLARYLDWLVTTPLMLYELCHIAHAPTHVIMMVCGCDILMLIFGIVAALIPQKHFKLKYAWFTASCVFYVTMQYCLYIDVANGSALNEPEHIQKLFNRLQVLFIVVWSCYPFVVIAGRAHACLISRAAEDFILCCLDMTAKIGMEGFIVVNAIINAGTGDGSGSTSFDIGVGSSGSGSSSGAGFASGGH